MRGPGARRLDGHGLPARVNPLAFGPLGTPWDRLDAAETRRRAAVVFGRWLVPLRGLVVGRAVNLSTGLTQALTRAVPPAASLQRRSASTSARETRVAGASERLLDRAQAAALILAATRSSQDAPLSGVRRAAQRDL